MRQGAPGATAADFPPTARALELLVRRCAAVLVAAPVLAALVLWALLSGGGSEPGGSRSVAYGVMLGVVPPTGALVWLGYGRRMRAALRRGPWTACRATTVTSGTNRPTVVVQDPVTGELRVYAAYTTLWGMDLADPGPAGVLWWCEGAKGDGVVSRPGGGGLVRVKPARSNRKREAGLAQAARHGLLRPPPGSRQPWVGPGSRQPEWGSPPGARGWAQGAQQDGVPQGPYPHPHPYPAPGPYPGHGPGPGPYPQQGPGRGGS